MLVEALETEVAAYLEAHRDERDGEGRALVVRNGKGRTRKVTVGAGTIPVSAPRVNDGGWTRRQAAPLHQPHPAALHAPLPEGGRGVARPLPARSLHRRLPRGARRVARKRCRRFVRHEYSADQRVGDRVPGLPEAEPCRSRLRLRVGRWRALQRPAAGRSPLHVRHDRCAARRDEGADYDRGRLPGERRELEDRAPRLEAPRQGPVYSASVESTSTPGLHGTSFKLTSSTPGSEQVVIMGRPLLRKTLIIGRFSASTKA